MRKIFKKNQKKKGTKGFTLVELLAVLTILATILLLVVPTVLSVIKKSETTVDQESITRYGRAIKQSILEYQLDHNENVSGFYEYRADNDKYITNVENNDVEIKLTYEGNKVTCGVILADIYGEVYLDDCKINDKSVEYTYGNSEDFFYYLYEPDLYNDSLVPVYYDGNDWIVTNSVSSDWYDYKKQKWANAVILANGVEKKEGDTVSVTGSNPDVIAMFVWIPRYEYKIEGTYGKMD